MALSRVVNVKTGEVLEAHYDDGVTPEAALAADRASMRCSRFQAKAALAQSGLLSDVEIAIASSDEVTRIAWSDAVEFRRDSPTIAKIATDLELSDSQVDDLFRAAMGITA